MALNYSFAKLETDMASPAGRVVIPSRVLRSERLAVRHAKGWSWRRVRELAVHASAKAVLGKFRDVRGSCLHTYPTTPHFRIHAVLLSGVSLAHLHTSFPLTSLLSEASVQYGDE